MRFELKLNTIRKMGFELKLSPIRKKALELKLKPKVWLRIFTCSHSTFESVQFAIGGVVSQKN